MQVYGDGLLMLRTGQEELHGCRGGTGTHIISQHGIKLCQGSNSVDVQGIEPALLKGAEMAFYLTLAGPVADTGM